MDFDLYYNCAVVVALRVKQADGSMKYLGYLCCDTLNTDLSKEVFDKEVAQLLFSMAQLYATFLETLDSNWIDRMQDNFEFEQNFLELICKKTYHGKKRWGKMSRTVVKKVNSSTKKHSSYGTEKKACKSKSAKCVSMPVNALMPSGYTYSQRAKLREFENNMIKWICAYWKNPMSALGRVKEE